MASPARSKAERRFEGKTIFGTGFSRGTGLTTALDLAEEGANLIALTTDAQKFLKNAAPQFQERIPGFRSGNITIVLNNGRPQKLSRLPTPTIYVIEGALETPTDVTSTYVQLWRNGIRATDMVHAGAGGMESYSRHAATGLMRIGRIPAEEEARRNEAKAEFRAKSQLWIAQNWDKAERINLRGPEGLLNYIPHMMAEGEKKFINLSSWPSTFLGLAEVWTFYLTIAGTKGLFHQWTLDNFDQLAKIGVLPKTLSAPIIGELDEEGKRTGRGIDVGDILLTTLPKLMTAEDAITLNKTAVTRQQTSAAIRGLLLEDTSGWTKENSTVFISGPDGTLSYDLTPQSPGVNIKLGI